MSSDDEAEEGECSDEQQENAGDTHNQVGGAAPEEAEDEQDAGPPPDRCVQRISPHPSFMLQCCCVIVNLNLGFRILVGGKRFW